MTMIPARPTTYRGIQMRSRLEALYAAAMDANGVTWEYEPRAFANERGQYLPDFLVIDGPLRYYVEVRPTVERGLLAPERMAIIWDSEPDAELFVWIDEGFLALRGDPATRRWTWVQ